MIKYAKRQDIGQTSGKMHLILKIKICVKHLESEASCQLPVLLLVIYTFILSIYKPMINIIISLKGLQKICDRLYI